MSGNRSLDEFAGAGAGEGSDEEGAGGQRAEAAGAEEAPEVDDGETEADDAVAEGGDAAAEADDAEADPASTDVDAGYATGAEETDVDDATPEPPASTYVWSPGGGPCGACGSTVEERWRDGEDLVCAGCKEW